MKLPKGYRMVPALSMQDELTKAWRAALAQDADRMAWYYSAPGCNLLPALDENDWNTDERVVIHDGDDGQHVHERRRYRLG